MHSFALLLLALVCVQATRGSYTHHCTLYANGETKVTTRSRCSTQGLVSQAACQSPPPNQHSMLGLKSACADARCQQSCCCIDMWMNGSIENDVLHLACRAGVLPLLLQHNSTLEGRRPGPSSY